MNNALVIFFNTDFSKNIPILEKIYGPRFSDILYVVPDHSSRFRLQYTDPKISYSLVNKKDKVVNTARRLAGKKNSHEIVGDEHKNKIERVVGFQYFFQDYFWQARKRILSMNADWYWFVSDDVLIHPGITQNNIQDQLSSKQDLSFISAPHHPSTAWIHWFQESKTKTMKKLQSVNCFVDDPLNMGLSNDSNQQAPYEKDLLGGCADIFAIHHSRIDNFLKLCHLTALEKIFVELAIPNILISHCGPVTFIKDYVWDFEMNRGDWGKVHEFLENDQFYYHPVKLSLLNENQIKMLLPS